MLCWPLTAFVGVVGRFGFFLEFVIGCRICVCV